MPARIISQPVLCAHCHQEFAPTEKQSYNSRRGLRVYCKAACRREGRIKPVPKQSPIERFMKFVEVQPDGCWKWTGHIDSEGYGRFKLNGRWRLAHCVSHEIHKGNVPDGLEIDHVCRHRWCVNPDCLEAVTHAENMRRGVANAVPSSMARMAKTICKQGHALTPDNIYWTKERHRKCRACRRIWKEESRARLKSGSGPEV